MKAINLGICSALFMLFSITSFADKLVIKGAPIMLYEQGGVYYTPDTYTTTTTYNYVTIGGTQNVCYLQPQPALSVLNNQLISVNIRGQTVQWTCYNYDENYFTVSP